MSRVVRYVAVGFPVLHWDQRRLILRRSGGATPLAFTGFGVALLDYLQTPRAFAEITERFTDAPPGWLRKVLRRMQKAGLVGHPTTEGERPPHPLDGWSRWAPVASAFHFATRDPRILHDEEACASDMLADVEQPARASGVAASTERRHSARRIKDLPAPSRQDGFSRVVRARRTWRVLGAHPVPKQALSEILHLACGVQRRGTTSDGHAVALTTSPSAGARHPIGACLAIRNVEGIAPGLYRYLDDEHRLERIRSGVTAREIEIFLGHNWWFTPAGAVVFLVGRVGAVTGRYDHPRAYRFLLLEAGHVCQTFCLAATWQGLAPFCTAALADSKIERAFGLDGLDELVLYAAGVGTRPKTGYQQWPEHEAGKSHLPERRVGQSKGPGRRPR